jgi:RNA polymerase sigma-70 factor, ECF subfamily
MLTAAETRTPASISGSRLPACLGRGDFAPALLPPTARLARPPAGAASPPRRVFDFDGLYRHYERSVYSKCFRIVRNHTEAEDLVQEVFLQLLRKADTFRGEAKFSTWLHRLTINAALMQLRRLRRSELRTTSLEGSPGGAEDHALAPKAALPRHASAALAADRVSVRVAVGQLPHGYRQVLSLHDIEGYTHAEIASKLGMSVGASKSQLHRARLRLRNLLQKGNKPLRCQAHVHAAGARMAAPLSTRSEDHFVKATMQSLAAA